MAQVKTGKSQEFDSIVIGGGLSGLLVAHQLEGTGRKVALVEALDVLGGTSRPQNSVLGPIDNGMKFMPATPAARANLEWLETVLGTSLSIEEIDEPPVTYDNGKFQPFVGFGAFEPEAAAELAPFSTPRRFVTTATPKDWVKTLAGSFTGTTFLQSHVTKLQYDDGFIIEILVNGTKKLSAREYIFCASPRDLAPLIPENTASARQKHRLSKGKFFTAVYLDLIHGKAVSESRQLHMLKSANEEPLAGLFHPAMTLSSGETVQLSQWCTFLRADLTDDAEETANALKRIKRQVKRAYETALDGLVSERIVVSPQSHGEVEGLLSEDQRWPKIENLWVASHFFNPHRDLIGTLDQARLVLENFRSPHLETDLEENAAPGSNLTV
ncbi:MAG: NAD(P)-binding protein [Bdellovibrionaceae bacterium]|nr:NAD(P)-binding protein [Pseudobdellovibrionaceae bacterium]